MKPEHIMPDMEEAEIKYEIALRAVQEADKLLVAAIYNRYEAALALRMASNPAAANAMYNSINRDSAQRAGYYGEVIGMPAQATDDLLTVLLQRMAAHEPKVWEFARHKAPRSE